MSKRIIAVNAGPRKGWNTDTLITEASKGAESAGATVERFDLFKLEKYTGCISCFGCKKEKFKGQCICRDGLKPVLDAIRESDGLIIGSPNYLSELTASFRALYERLIFQNLTYNKENPCCNAHTIPVLLIMTSNAPDTMYQQLLNNYQQVLSRFVGPTEVLSVAIRCSSRITAKPTGHGHCSIPKTRYDAMKLFFRKNAVQFLKKALSW